MSIWGISSYVKLHLLPISSPTITAPPAIHQKGAVTVGAGKYTPSFRMNNHQQPTLKVNIKPFIWKRNYLLISGACPVSKF